MTPLYLRRARAVCKGLPLWGDTSVRTKNGTFRIPHQSALHLLTCLGWVFRTRRERERAREVAFAWSGLRRRAVWRLLPLLLPERLQAAHLDPTRRKFDEGRLGKSPTRSRALSFLGLASTKSLRAPERADRGGPGRSRMSPGPTCRIYSGDNNHPDL